MKTFAKVLLTVFSVFYPFGLYFFGEFSGVLLAVMAILWAFRGLSERDSNFRAFAYAMSGFFLLCLASRNLGAQYLYPVLVSAFLAVIFYLSLRGEAVITRIARLQEGGTLPKSVVSYTRRLTVVWLWFFILNGAASAVLACFEDKIYWSFYTGALSYVLVGALFGGEMIFRKFYVKNA